MHENAHRPVRIVLSKLGLDGHDRGVKVVSRALREAGMEVIYTGLWRSSRQVARAAADEDADAVGVSLLSGAHMALVPALLEALKEEGMGDVPVIVGGSIPAEDVETLKAQGVAAVFGPGASMWQIVTFIREAVSVEERA